MNEYPFAELRQSHFPYCLVRLTDGRYIVVNRRYKPLGITATDWVDYETHTTAGHLHLTPETAAKLSYSGSRDLDTIYLYNDGCIPTRSEANMRAYLERLAVLMRLTPVNYAAPPAP